MQLRTDPIMHLLYNPPSSRRRTPVLPMSLMALAGASGRQDRLRLVDGNREADPTEALLAAAEGARSVGMTVMGHPQLAFAIEACRALRARRPELPILWGGYFPSLHTELVLASGLVDLVLPGWAELSYRGVLEALEGGGDPGAVPGVRSAGATARHSPAIEGASAAIEGAAFDGPWPAAPPLDWIDPSPYLRSGELGRRIMGWHTSRGCPHRCAFCAVVPMCGGRWRGRPGAMVAAECLELRRRFAIDGLEFHDNNFFADGKRVLAFAEDMVGAGLSWWAEGRVDDLDDFDDEAWRLLRRSGLRMVFMGAEAASAETLRRMAKGGGVSGTRTEGLVRRMARFAIVPELSFVVGLPPDPMADMERTGSFVRRLRELAPALHAILYAYTPVAVAGGLSEDAASAGFRFPERLEEWMAPRWQAFERRKGEGLPWMGPEALARFRALEAELSAPYVGPGEAE